MYPVYLPFFFPLAELLDAVSRENSASWHEYKNREMWAGLQSISPADIRRKKYVTSQRVYCLILSVISLSQQPCKATDIERVGIPVRRTGTILASTAEKYLPTRQRAYRERQSPRMRGIRWHVSFINGANNPIFVATFPASPPPSCHSA